MLLTRFLVTTETISQLNNVHQSLTGFQILDQFLDGGIHSHAFFEIYVRSKINTL